MNKKVLIAAIIVAIATGAIIPSIPTLANGVKQNQINFQNQERYEINSIFELKEEISKNNMKNRDDATRNQIINKTRPDILTEYYDEMNNEIIKKINTSKDIKLTINPYEKMETQEYSSTIKLADGGEIVVKDIFESVNDLEKATKPYGNYSYKTTYDVYHFMYPNTVLSLVTFYSAASDGLRATSTSIAGTSALYPNKVSGTSKVTDNRAEKIGTDINGQGDYNFTQELAGSQITQLALTMVSNIQWVTKLLQQI